MPRKCPCGKAPSYNVPGETIRICCAGCKTDDMIDIKSNKCSCGNRPVFNMLGQKGGVCCKNCKTDEMIDVKNKKCSCGKQPVFNVPGEKIGMCCKICKTDEMIDIKNNRCPCGKQPTFNVPGHSRGVCCKDCKADDMIDVVDKLCPCGTRPNFNVSGEKIGVCCVKCKTDEMVDVKSKRCPCGSRPTYNIFGQTIGVCCVKCKTGDMINVVSKMCPGYNGDCPVRTQLKNGREYCMSCDPNDARRKRYKRYEETFFAYAKDKLNVHKREFHVSFDQNETSKKFARLDGIVFGEQVIICIEVDEDGHCDYECDEHRMHLVTAELLQKYPDKVVSWVRVNPTIDAKSQWSKTSKNIREKRFEDVVMTVKDILENRDIRVMYIGFD